MKIIKVVAAVIKSINDKGQTVILSTQRWYGEFKDSWEFPGGKIEKGETPQEALKREIMEDEWLTADIKLIENIRENMLGDKNLKLKAGIAMLIWNTEVYFL